VKEVAVKDGDKVAVGQLMLVLDGAGLGEQALPSAGTGQPGLPPTAGATRGAAAAAQAATPERQAEKGQPMAPAARATAPATAKGAGTGAVAPPRPNVPAAPSVRRLARELGLDIADVPGSGKGGRISETDVRSHAKNVITGKVAGPAGAAPAGGGFAYEPLPDFSVYGAVERKAMRGIRRKTAEHMVASWHTIPHVTQVEKVDITDLEQLRKKFGKRVEAGGGKLTVTSIITKVIALAMRKFPQVNSSVDLAAEEVIFKSYVNIGIAVDTERGLLVPVLRDVDTKSITQISAELAQLAEKARNGKLSMDEMSGGCFTITNLGGIGGTQFTPIVNHPEVAIMGMSRSAMEPVWNGTSFEPRLMLPLSLSYDHRIIDGADAMRFLRFVAEALEQPFLLAL
jgi:pyruvate dehydrogenase E2 component (dihydrolipoamide acetyltransferase)